MIVRNVKRCPCNIGAPHSIITLGHEVSSKENYMRIRSLVSILAVFVLLAVAYAASNVDGTWTGQRPGRDGNMMPVTFKFKAAGSTLTGSTTMRENDIPISDGKITGSDVSFTVKMEFGGNSVVTKYTGTVSGSEMKLKSQREGSDRVTEITLKKS